MTSTAHRPESTAAALYVAIELSTKEWLLTMSTAPDARRHRVRVQPGDRVALERALAEGKRRAGRAADAPVRSCYEAGRDGFWPHRLLTQLGVVSLVVDSSSIEVRAGCVGPRASTIPRITRCHATGGGSWPSCRPRRPATLRSPSS